MCVRRLAPVDPRGTPIAEELRSGIRALIADDLSIDPLQVSA